jgi:hypothetical protein
MERQAAALSAPPGMFLSDQRRRLVGVVVADASTRSVVSP